MGAAIQVAVVGGGIGGLTAAHALARRGCDVHVYEAAPELREIGAGVDLGPNAMKVLRSLGLEAAVREIGWENPSRVWRHWRTGAQTMRLDPRDVRRRYGATACSVHRADLLDVLAEHLPAAVTVTLGARCVSVETDGAAARARFADGSSAEADVLVGADGIRSAVRASLFGPDAPRFTGKVCYRTVVPIADLPDGAEVRDSGNARGPGGLFVLYGLRRGELINVACHFDDDSYTEEAWSAECDSAEIVARYAGWHPSFRRIFAADPVWLKWALHDRDPMTAWTLGRITLLGDAAHPMLPYLGQGASQAIEDGVVLAAALRQRADDLPAALKLYEDVRLPRASRIVVASRERAEVNHLVSPFAAWRRDMSIALRKRLTSDPGGRGDSWIPDYDASAPEVLAGSRYAAPGHL